ncbi:MAG TPA: SDR family NAD(P)-dependent oxidoreductase, partial [Mycobacterium sp.]|nr:SDR family NAD(P)-dependent oxidoreductase [Mycobacterium sp.]
MSIPHTTLLTGRTALVTGAASGIGRAIAAHYLAAGAHVVLADRAQHVVDVAGDLGAAAGLVFDATDEQQVTDAVAAAGAALGRIDILVTSHGILTQSPLSDMPVKQWQETLDVDLTSVFLLNRAVVAGMVARGGGRIINVASQLGIKGGASVAHYAAAKAGVIAMTKSLALEVSSHGVLVNAIAPGPI